MIYELIQAALTNLITFTAIAGFTGIIAHAIWTSHCNWMTEYCPTVGYSNPVFEPLAENLQKEIFHLAAVLEANEQEQEPVDIWEGAIATSSPRYWVRPTQPPAQPILCLPPAKEIKPAKKLARPQQNPRPPLRLDGRRSLKLFHNVFRAIALT